MISFILGFLCGACTLIAISSCVAAGNADKSMTGFPTKEYVETPVKSDERPIKMDSEN